MNINDFKFKYNGWIFAYTIVNFTNFNLLCKIYFTLATFFNLDKI